MDECLCRLLDDHESFDDPWDELDRASPAFQAKMRAVDGLRPVPGQSGLANASLRSCSSCGAWYCYTHSFIPHSDHDRLEVDRLSGEASHEPCQWPVSAGSTAASGRGSPYTVGTERMKSWRSAYVYAPWNGTAITSPSSIRSA